MGRVMGVGVWNTKSVFIWIDPKSEWTELCLDRQM